ncbi:MAG: M61 family metallopeptidase [Burkholderiaceae bacterium]|nr:M61 family metallopeptidase [Burkholderiaceae bacterium]
MTIAYAVELAEPHAHIFRVTVTVPAPLDQEQVFTLPTWVPGSYMIRDMAGQIVSLKAVGNDVSLPVTKIDKSTWRVSTRGLTGELSLVYEVYAQDPSVRLAYLDCERAFFNPSSLLLCPLGFEKEPITLDLIKNDSPAYKHWQVATGLVRDKATKRWRFGRYHADNYEQLIDCPVEIGAFKTLSFKAHGVRHDIVLSGHVPAFDEVRLVTDVKAACERTIELFDPKAKKAPFKEYTFFLNLTVGSYGGLEHANSTALIASFEDLPFADTGKDEKGYQSLLTLFTHEYFHAWWVKRVKPAMFVPYDLSRETYTTLLWVFEGFTSFYDEKLVHEAGLVTTQAYARALSESLTQHMSCTARLRQSLAESSFDAWIKYYKPDGNRPNAVVSYYVKGGLVAMALDAHIRRMSKNERSLDDVLRYAYQQFVEAGSDYAGLDEDFIGELIWEATGVDVTDQLQAWVYGCEEPDYVQALKSMGYGAKYETQSLVRSRLGVSVRADGVESVVTQVFDATAAQAAGLAAGDRLVALDNVRVEASKLEKMISRIPVDEPVSLYVFRGGILLPLVVTMGAPCKDKIIVQTKKNGKKGR